MTTLTETQETQFRDLVIAKHGEVFTTSRKISELFGKRHADVLRAISCLECSASFNERNFALVEYRDGKGEARPEYLITKDGMVFLVMGFTGKQAARFKELYILAFNWMAEQVRTVHELTHWQHDFTRREAASVANGSMHGQGLARRRIEKHALSQEQAAIHAKLQLCLNLTGEVAA